MLSTKEFLETVITGPAEGGYFLLAIGNNETNWKEIWYEWPRDIDAIVENAESLCEETNVYFSTYLFKTRSTTKDNVLPTKTIQADLDEADINNLPVPPTVLVQTSPGRHQGYWLLTDFNDLELHEILSRKLTYAIPSCDHSGWPLGRKVRIPNTYNYKYSEGRHPVRIVSYAKRLYEAAHLELLPDAPPAASEEIDSKFLSEPTAIEIGPQELLNRIREKIPVEIYNTYNNQAQDRSIALWKLMCSAFRAGLTRDEVYWLARGSANNKFSSLRFNGDRELAKDVLRAEAVVASGITDTREMIAKARKLAGSQHDKRQHMLDIVFDMMSIQGKFIRTPESNNYYIRTDIGRPILMTERSEYLLTLLDMEFGLNPTEPETKYVAAGVCNKVRDIKLQGESAALSFYDKNMATVFLHTGRKDVIRITKNSIGTVTDGAFDLIFPWSNTQEPFKLDFGEMDKSWDEVLFGDTVNNVMGMAREDALALLRVWFLFIFLRKEAISRPILALFGAPGSGKSTTFRKVYALLYGKNKSLGAVTTPEDFDYAVSNAPLVVLDNVDSWERWLPDRLALAASTSDIDKRKLYTDFDTVTLKRQSILAVTAHDPKFGREDVTDRLLILNLKRLDSFRPETPLIYSILDNRNKLFGAIVRDLQRVLGEGEPEHHDIPQIRVEDFARVGYKIACALGIQKEFTSSINSLRGNQKSFLLEQDSILVDAIKKLIQRETKAGEYKYRSAGELWIQLEAITEEKLMKETYHNAPTLGKKLWNLYDSLKTTFDISVKFDTAKGSKTWQFKPKLGDELGTA